MRIAPLLALAALAAGSVPAAGAAVLPLGDDDAIEVPFTAGFSFPLFGTTWGSVFVNSNGSLTFGRGDILSVPDAAPFLSGPPRISLLWTDLDPTAGGEIRVTETPTTFTVTFDGVAAFGETAGNTMGAVLRSDGSFDLFYGTMGASEGFTGYSAGGKVTRGDETPRDLSAQTRPIGNGSRPAIHEIFDASSPFDLAGQTLPFRPTWDHFRFYASDASGGNLLRLSGWSGEGVVVGPLGFGSVEGLSFSPSGDLYGVDTGAYPLSATLVRIDPATGAATAVGPIGFPVVDSLAFAPDGTLFAVEMDPDVDETSLITIDPATGAGTFRASLAAAAVEGLAFGAGGTLYEVDDDTDRLLVVDPVTGAETPVGPLGFDGVQGLEAIADGRLFAVRSELAPGGGFRSSLLAVNRTTGRATEIGGMTGPAAAAGLAWRCEATNGGVEMCDGLDNDCDGLGDEEFAGLGTSCVSGLGACRRDGSVVCRLDGSGTECDAVPGKPAPEACDGLDGDCNGTVEDNLDVDKDGRSICGGDCNDSDGGVLQAPGEVTNLRHLGGNWAWDDLGPAAGSATRYDVVVALWPDFTDAQCLIGDVPGPATPDSSVPPSYPSVLYFLVRAQNPCGDGSWGADSDGNPRSVPVADCP